MAKGPLGSEKQSKKRKRHEDIDNSAATKKRKSEGGATAKNEFRDSEDFISLDDGAPAPTTSAAATVAQQKPKKASKKRRLIARAKARGEDPPVFDGSPSTAQEATQSMAESQETNSTQKPNARFIAFIGNLPFTATVESVKTHFKSIQPDLVRLPTQEKHDKSAHKGNKNPSGPKAGQSKGFAFLEFSSYDRMKTCLKLYHHTNFDDGLGNPRKINVELTAGGGGSSKDRMARIKEKNVRLSDERQRRKVEEKKRGDRATKKGNATPSKNGEAVAQQPQGSADIHNSDDGSGMHPARRAMLEQQGRR